ncbi:preprotein translocase subunit SecE [Arcanobacterium canis]|uniref:Protein translocase subunit SecE n=1 Tax=Arcanobacterium canis TaxID=999183 RepID=A0ABY8FZM6_9ACTO|nr:preprotein translocase subunit SecE [Arcanobacterium canis]WFM83772.1 preprotein translocase subunit SecE [Arcanobacterium canis]
MNEARSSAVKEGFFARIITFFKEVIAEFKKVQRPTREELWKMFVTVVIFVTIIMVFVTAIDLVFNQSMFWIFG